MYTRVNDMRCLRKPPDNHHAVKVPIPGYTRDLDLQCKEAWPGRRDVSFCPNVSHL